MTAAQAMDLRQALAERLLAVDPRISAIVLFGSAVYLPDAARDLDVLVLTPRPLALPRYDLAVADLRLPVDLIVQRTGESIGDLAQALRPSGIWLHGHPAVLAEVIAAMPPTADRIDDALTAARATFDTAVAPDRRPGVREELLKRAFDGLFHAARYVAMAALQSDEERWGEVAKALPRPLEKRFRALIASAHRKYAYEGRFPDDLDALRQEFDRLEAEVRAFARTAGLQVGGS